MELESFRQFSWGVEPISHSYCSPFVYVCSVKYSSYDLGWVHSMVCTTNKIAVQPHVPFTGAYPERLLRGYAELPDLFQGKRLFFESVVARSRHQESTSRRAGKHDFFKTVRQNLARANWYFVCSLCYDYALALI